VKNESRTVTELTPVQLVLNYMQYDENTHNQILPTHLPKAKTKWRSPNERRGRKAAKVPSGRHLEILKATKTQTYEKVGASYGISKQRVAEIARRWKEYLPVRSLPAPKAIRNRCEDEPPRRRENRIHVVSFRLTDSDVQLLRSRYPEMKSVDRAARGIVTKFLSI